MPSGMRVLEEGEREEMLAALSRSKHDIESQLRGMPFVVETPSQVLDHAMLRMSWVEDCLVLKAACRTCYVPIDKMLTANCIA